MNYLHTRGQHTTNRRGVHNVTLNNKGVIQGRSGHGAILTIRPISRHMRFNNDFNILFLNFRSFGDFFFLGLYTRRVRRVSSLPILIKHTYRYVVSPTIQLTTSVRRRITINGLCGVIYNQLVTIRIGTIIR